MPSYSYRGWVFFCDVLGTCRRRDNRIRSTTISTIHGSNSRSIHTPPKPFASDIDMSDKGFGTRKETLEEEEVDFRFGKYKGMEAAGLKREETNDDGYDDELGKLKSINIV